MRQKLLATGVVTVSIAASLSVIGAAPASAGTKFGCKYPRVCLYLHRSDWTARKPTAAYQQVTQDFQTLGPHGRNAYAVYNSRNDDGALLVDSDDMETCVGPNETWIAEPNSVPYKIVGILIGDLPHCYPE
ncbi:hypothetical protein [Actinoplanes sp. NPDC026623]|uniref:hypothetical protein n=1 Tax=Actinoplanes sp. NPDC026623 TaxID=3155610 RepID=UPI0033FD6BDB